MKNRVSQFFPWNFHVVILPNAIFYLILRLRKLERKLEENKIKEEKEAQDLEAMVQHVEQNLQLMTVSAAIPIS